MFLLSKPFRRSQLSIAALFFFLGFHYATWASRLPALKERLNLNSAELGLLLLACGLGAAISFPIVATLMEKLGSRRLICLATAMLGTMLLAMGWVPTYESAIVVMFCNGIAIASLNSAMNAQGAALEIKSQQNTMSKLHAIFSFGSLSAALLSSAVIFFTPSLPIHFVVAAVVLVTLFVFARPALLVDDLPSSKKEDGKRLSMPSRITLWFGFAMFFGTIVEGSMNDWSALYLSDIAGASSQIAPLGIAVYAVMMVLARLFADNWRTRFGDARVVLIGSALTASGLTFSLVSGGVVPALIGFACMGLGMAAVTPCMYVGAAKHGPNALTLVAAMGVTGLLAGPPIIGFISNASTLVWGMGAVALSAFLVALCTTQIRWSNNADAEPQPAFAAEESRQAV
jgi:MFS family permease